MRPEIKVLWRNRADADFIEVSVPDGICVAEFFELYYSDSSLSEYLILVNGSAIVPSQQLATGDKISVLLQTAKPPTASYPPLPEIWPVDIPADEIDEEFDMDPFDDIEVDVEPLEPLPPINGLWKIPECPYQETDILVDLRWMAFDMEGYNILYLEPGDTVRDVFNRVFPDLAFDKDSHEFNVCVNLDFAEGDTLLSKGDRVALIHKAQLKEKKRRKDGTEA